jgi:hypothetical protein
MRKNTKTVQNLLLLKSPQLKWSKMKTRKKL